jgi:lysophospholipase L1-like esterase
VVAIAGVLGVYAPNFDRHPDVAHPAALTGKATYVALGDSYSAGEGLEAYVPGTGDKPGNRCHRSTLAYGAVLGSGTSGATPGFRACSGALITNILDHEQEHDGVKVGGVQVPTVDPTATLVTITISGNDAQFANIVSFCFTKSDCLHNTGWRPGDGPEETVQAYADRRLPQIRDTLLPDLYRRLTEHFTNPDVRIVVLGYPRLFTTGPELATQRFCQRVYRRFSSDERQALRDLGDSFNTIVANQAIAAGLEYVEVADAFEGHETCGPKGPWLSFLHDGLRELESFHRSGGVDPGDFHPTASGQAMFARLVDCYLRVNPQPPSADGGAAVGRRGDDVYACATQHPADPPELRVAGS